jgi:general nucleoside transport system ATP-binding protein
MGEKLSVLASGEKAIPRLEVHTLTKCFGSLVANDGISLTVLPGELHCLLGENGAGKSTLSSCLYGLSRPDAGEILIDGTKVELRTPADAIKAGVGMVHQHFVLVSTFTVLENIVVGTGRSWRLDVSAARRRIEELCGRFGLELAPDRLVSQLSVGERQWVEIVKALYLGARLLILDEPTAVLTPQESQRLFAIIDQLKAAGISVILITHKMNEVMRSDRVSVLRKGRLVATVETSKVSRDDLTLMMVGRMVKPVEARDSAPDGTIALSIRGLTLGISRSHRLPAINIDVDRGEILGIAGVAGNGQDELLEAIAGLAKRQAGTMLLHGQDIGNMTAHEIAKHGVGYVPSDRFRDGLVPDFTIAENLILGRHRDRQWMRGPFLDRTAITQRGDEAISVYSIAVANPRMPCDRLSGGNAQKVIIAREFAKARHLLLCNQPTRGVDVGAIEFIHGELLAKRATGCAIVLVSEELDDLLTLSDHIAVMFRGEIMGVFERGAADITTIGRLMAGQREGVPS